MNSYNLSRAWFDWCFENPEKITPTHTALYFFAIEHCNRLGWKKKFGFPTTMVMEAIGIKSYNTYKKVLFQLVDFGFIEMIEKSKNQYSSNIIALSKYDKANNKALDKALTKHTSKQGESTVSIDKQVTKEQRTINIEFDLFWNAYQKKTDTAKCKAKWSKLKDEEREKAMSHVPRYVNSTPDKQYRKNPLTYLNGKCWNDEISNEITNNSTKSLTPNDGIERKRYYFKQEQGTFKVMTEQEALDYCEKYATEWWKTEPTQIVDYGN